MNTQSKEGRILVLGSANHTKLVSAYDWDKLPSNLNIADFDTVILNFAPFQNRAFAQAININLIPDWRQFARHIFSEASEVIVIGSPNFQLGSNPYLASDWWLPVEPLFVYASGDAIRAVAKDFAFYFDVVRHWSFHLHAFGGKPPDFVRNYSSMANPHADSISIASNVPLAQTRFQSSIGFKLSFYLFRAYFVAATFSRDQGPCFGFQSQRS